MAMLPALAVQSGTPSAKQTKDIYAENKAIPSNRPVKDKWALIVGISKFKDSKINLKYPAKDATDFYNYLIGDGHFDKSHVLLLTDEKATRQNILSVIGDKWLPRVVNPDDLVVIYISSHGSPADLDVGGVNYLVAHDTDAECLYATGIPLQDLMRTIKQRVHCDRIVIILDACHSGAASAESKGLYRVGNVSASHMVAGTGQLVIASSRPDQVSWESKKYDNGVFTKHLIESLKLNGGKTRLGDAFVNLKDRVQEEVLLERGQMQTPDMKSQWRGDDLILSIIPSQPRIGIPSQTFDFEPTPSQQSNAVQSSPQTTTPLPPPKTVLNNGNIYRVFNRPTSPTMFSIDSQALITYIFTYHWNDARGRTPGTIALRHSDGTTYGPWQTIGKPGQGNVPNAYWECEPMIDIKAGTYTVIDSDPSTWAQNAGSNGSGICKINAVVSSELQSPTTTHVSTLKRSPVTKVFDNGNIYLVYNKPVKPTSFLIDKPVLVTSITNYHWNNGTGQLPGTITLMDQNGRRYGPYQCSGSPGQGGVPNAYWRCDPDLLLQPGMYMIIDSDATTWSQNPQSEGSGICGIQGVYQN
jgi:hypothetical protein